jgi:hypothetical protein
MEGRRGFVKIVVGRDNIVTELFSYQMLSKEEKREKRKEGSKVRVGGGRGIISRILEGGLWLVRMRELGRRRSWRKVGCEGRDARF